MPKICKHEATMGPVAAPFAFCVFCKKKVKNPDYAEDQRMMANAKKHPNSRTNPYAVALRRLKDLKAGKGKLVPYDLADLKKKAKKKKK